MKKTLITLVLSFLVLNTFAQNEAANWYFGFGAGIQFNRNTNNVSSVNNGQLFTNEGCASISDSSGNLLFYTDGSAVWNRNHNFMVNGTGLLGDSSSTQSAIIVPKPDNPNIYYVFTVDNNIDNFNYGLNYSTIDLSLNSGLGEVTKKNVTLLEECSEKISAVVKDCITKSVWVVTLASADGSPGFFNTYHAFEVSATGINTTSVKSTFNINIVDARGYLKLSPDGTKAACANMTGTIDETSTVDRLLLYDFDVATGNFSNQKQLEVSGDNNYPYGIEFSQNSNLLYVTASNNFFDRNNPQENLNPTNHNSTLAQYDLTLSDVQSTEVILDVRQLYRGGLQLGPDGKIYRALCETYTDGLPYLGAINNPNIIGAASNYQHDAIHLAPNNSTQGLPPFITSFFLEKIDIIGNNSTTTSLPLCNGDSYILKAEDIPGAIYTWTLDDTKLTENDFDLEVFSAGAYKVIVDVSTGDCNTIEGEAFVTFSPNPKAYDAELIQCDEDAIPGGFTRFNLNEAHEVLTGGAMDLSTKFYSDSAGLVEIIDANTFNFDANNPQLIYAKVINSAGCFDISELTLNVSLTQIDDYNAPPICDEIGSEDGISTFNLEDFTADIQTLNSISFPVIYYETYENALSEEKDLGPSYTNTLSPYSQTIYARSEDDNDCYGIFEVFLTVNPLPEIEIEDLAYYCLNKFPETVSINAGNLVGSLNDYTYNWSTGENTHQIEINEAKSYTVLVTNKNTQCSKNRTVTIEASNTATFESFEVTDATQNNVVTVVIDPKSEGVYKYQLRYENNDSYLPYQESSTFENIKPGIYIAAVKDVKNDCGTVFDKVSVIGFPKFFTPNNDGVNDTWQVFGISNMFQPNTKIQIFNRYGKLVKELDPLSKGWDGVFNGETLPTDDYWFAVTLQDGRIFKNHFTLKK
jgi:gliding motility-associated-like protein